MSLRDLLLPPGAEFHNIRISEQLHLYWWYSFGYLDGCYTNGRLSGRRGFGCIYYKQFLLYGIFLIVKEILTFEMDPETSAVIC